MNGQYLKAAVLSASVLTCEMGLSGPYAVRLPSSPASWETTAATELTNYLDRILVGGTISVGGTSNVVFHVGDTAFAAAKGCSTKSFKDEEWVVRSYGGDVVLNGGGTRGCLYAVYHLLEDQCGVRWWSDDEEDVPIDPSLDLPKLNSRGRPHFEYREIYRGLKVEDPVTWYDYKTAVRNRLQGNGDAGIPLSWGGGLVWGPPAACHTWERIVPFETYGEKHPEWFSLDKDGLTRIGGQNQGQLCLSNPELRGFFIGRVKAMIAAGDRRAKAGDGLSPRFYDISMNDNKHYCQCATCKSSQDKYGVSGDQLRFENEVARICGEGRPDILFTTLAYFDGEKIPLNGVRAADNVIVRLCNTRQNLAAGIFDPDNKFIHDQVKSWRNVAKNIFIWDYSITYDKATQGFPFPGEFYLGEKLRYYADNGVKGMFIEHEEPDKSDMWELKFHLQARFLENPKLDSKTVIADFMKRYYGPAGDKVLAARTHLDEIRRQKKAFVTWFPSASEFGFIGDEDIVRMNALWDAAEKLVADDPVRLRRVRRGRMNLKLVKDYRDKFSVCRHAPENGVSDVPFVDCLAVNGIGICGDGIAVVDDPEAVGGKAVKGDLTMKYMKLPFEMGVWSAADSTIVAKKTWEKPIGAGYRWYDLGVVEIPRKSYFVYLTRSWSIQAGPGLPELLGAKCQVKAQIKFTAGNIFVARVILIPQS